jgi:hypothetical protein
LDQTKQPCEPVLLFSLFSISILRNKIKILKIIIGKFSSGNLGGGNCLTPGCKKY